jgi:hypothetical protein
MCCHDKGKIGGNEWHEWWCHRKGGNMEKERKNGSLQGTRYEIVRHNMCTLTLMRVLLTIVAVTKQ